MEDNQPLTILELRVQQMKEWIDKRKHLFYTKSAKVTFNLRHEKVTGEITVYPDSE